MLNAQHQHKADMLKQLGVAALYALLLYVSHLYFESEAIVGRFEPSSGLALAALLIGGKKYAWGVLLGAILMSAIYIHSFWASVVIASSDTLQALFGAWLLTRKGKFNPRIQSLRDYMQLILLGGCAAIVIGTLTVNTLLLFFGLLPPENYVYSLIEWWMSDTLGVILIAPLILVWWWTKDGGNFSDWLDDIVWPNSFSRLAARQYRPSGQRLLDIPAHYLGGSACWSLWNRDRLDRGGDSSVVGRDSGHWFLCR
jgi:integral membrane sensor domain MASE1